MSIIKKKNRIFLLIFVFVFKMYYIISGRDNMTFYSKEINQAIDMLTPKEIEYLARIKVQEFIRQGYSRNAVKEEIKELIDLEQSSNANKESELLLVGHERDYY